MTLKAVFLDLDQTLVDRTHTFQSYLQQQYADLQIAQSGVMASDYFAAVHQWDDNGYRDKTETFQRVVDQLALSVSPDTLMGSRSDRTRHPVHFSFEAIKEPHRRLAGGGVEVYFRWGNREVSGVVLV